MTTDDGLLARMTLRLRQQICGLHGHDSLLNFDNGRMSLLCSSCGHESPGWDVRAGAVIAPSSGGPTAVHLGTFGDRLISARRLRWRKA